MIVGVVTNGVVLINNDSGCGINDSYFCASFKINILKSCNFSK